MSKGYKSSFKFSRKKLELFYSIGLLLIIPIMLGVNTILFTNSARNDFDTELRRKADLANQVFGSVIRESLDRPAEIQTSLESIQSGADDVTDIFVASYSDDRLIIIASSDLDRIGRDVTPDYSRDDIQDEIKKAESAGDQDRVNILENLWQYRLVIQEELPIAKLVETTDKGRVWTTLTPIFGDEDSEIVAITSMDVSLSEADALVAGSLQKSFYIMVATVIVTVLLLWDHFKFVEYAQLYKKLEEADQLKSDFLSVATHELKAPMSAIKGYVANVMDGTAGIISVEAMEQLNVVIQQTDRLNSLVQDLLNVSRIEQGHVEYKMEPVVAADIINPIISRYRERAENKGITIDYQEPAKGTKVFADAGRYEEIMTNLIDNAIKYSLKGKVTIAHNINSKNLETSVQDTGIGMSAAERDRLFQRFYRVRNEKTKDIGGTGLGLWIIKQYSEGMNGSVSVDSMKDSGTKFTISLKLPN